MSRNEMCIRDRAKCAGAGGVCHRGDRRYILRLSLIHISPFTMLDSGQFFVENVLNVVKGIIEQERNEMCIRDRWDTNSVRWNMIQ